MLVEGSVGFFLPFSWFGEGRRRIFSLQGLRCIYDVEISWFLFDVV